MKEQGYHQRSLSSEESILIMRGCCLLLKPRVGCGGRAERIYGVLSKTGIQALHFVIGCLFGLVDLSQSLLKQWEKDIGEK